MKKTVFIIAIFIAAFSSCEQDLPKAPPCPEELICTEEFRSLAFAPKENGEALLLDDAYVLNQDNGNTYTFFHENYFNRVAAYILASDAIMDELSKEGTVLTFVGRKNDQVVIEQDFLVGHDCCHIIGLDGPFFQE